MYIVKGYIIYSVNLMLESGTRHTIHWSVTAVACAEGNIVGLAVHRSLVVATTNTRPQSRVGS